MRMGANKKIVWAFTDYRIEKTTQDKSMRFYVALIT